jgi:hypothetical protein
MYRCGVVRKRIKQASYCINNIPGKHNKALSYLEKDGAFLFINIFSVTNRNYFYNQYLIKNVVDDPEEISLPDTVGLAAF